MTWGFVTCGPNEALVVSGKLIFDYFEIDFNEQWIERQQISLKILSFIINEVKNVINFERLFAKGKETIALSLENFFKSLILSRHVM